MPPRSEQAGWRQTIWATGLQPINDDATGLPLLHLPEGFRYRSFGWTGDPLDSGARTPGAHDGMAASTGSISISPTRRT
ncbi:MAG: DUF839 domain-containing protein [Acidobacteriota bacterium]|nr:DUF839 domain-containing protein [Acidobacteriota bacterium]